MINSVILIGRCSRDVELKFIPSTGLAVAKFNLAVDKGLYGEKKQEAQAQGKPTADLINITIFGKQAENVANFLTKGSQCAVHGRINTSNYTKDDGTKVYQTDVIADRVEFLDSKQDKQTQPRQAEFNGFPDDEDIFQPVDLDSEIPF